MATVTYDSQATLARFAKRRRMAYPVLADPGSQAIRAFGLLNQDYPPGSYAHGVAHPIIIVFDAEGVVSHRFSRAGYVFRPDPDVVLAELRKSVTGHAPAPAADDAEPAQSSVLESAWRQLKRVILDN